ncbi:hypothetical protein [Dictyobacter aurantiacus]|uniref:Uncharacterized protein n=1 Tax=Dictyobacter aurantiacus TaxID=1936993 RepID=A0A401ZQN0_9CHLR|nr:hypothetical protein [Dictyobacter aurantiacus]GCE09218.1 hypothetical protein KDAU_65470 [Dictyobacter aurantiacus]
MLSESQLSHSRISAVQNNRVELALFVQEHILFLCHHFHGFSSWGDIPYNWHLFGNVYTHALPPAVAPGEYIPLLVVLVDGASDRIVARRGLRLPPNFGKTLHDALRAQAMEPFSYGRFHLQVLHIHQEFPTPEDLLTKAQASCVFDAITTQRHRHN